jgi:hypothetical protein
MHRRPHFKETENMFNKTGWFIAASIFLGAAGANAQVRACYTLASLQGNYAVQTTYGNYVASAFGTRLYDGNGNMTGNFLINEPTAGSATGARTIVTGTQVGTYTVNCNGTGQISRILTQSNGTVTTSLDDFVITSGTVLNGQLIATAIFDCQEAPSAIVPGGVYVFRTHTRLPDLFVY